VNDEWSEAAGAPAPGIRPADLAGIELRHAIPGRIRLRIPAIKGKSDLLHEVQRQLSALPVIRHVDVNPVTASVLVLYDPADSAAIAQLSRLIIPGLDFDAMPAPGDLADSAGLAPPPPGEAVLALGRRLNRRIEAATGGTVDLKFLVPASLVVGAVARIIAARKVPSPTWYDFLWFAFGTYFTLNRGASPEGTGAAAPVALRTAGPDPEAGPPVTGDRDGDVVHE
jgi:hypothetical protein